MEQKVGGSVSQTDEEEMKAVLENSTATFGEQGKERTNEVMEYQATPCTWDRSSGCFFLHLDAIIVLRHGLWKYLFSSLMKSVWRQSTAFHKKEPPKGLPFWRLEIASRKSGTLTAKREL